MNPMKDVTLCLLSLALAGGSQAVGQQRDRSKVPDQYKWNLTDIYPTDDAWAKAKKQLADDIPSVAQYKGKLAQSAETLLACLTKVDDLTKEFARLSVYAHLYSDLDTRDSHQLSLVQEMSQVGSDFGAKSAFLQPEILAMGRATIDAFLKQQPKLEMYKHNLDDILRRQSHTGTAGEEKIIADAGLMADAPGNIFSIFSNADFPYPTVKLSNGKSVKLDQAAYTLYRAVPNRKDRMKVFSTFFGELDKYRRTFGTELYGAVKTHMFTEKARNYSSCLEAALDQDNIPTAVYRSLVNNVNANVATLQRYLKLRKRMLGVDQLHYYDLYAPVVKGVDLSYSIDEAEKHVLAALAPLGPSYVSVARKAFADRWVDVYPNTGKRSGAYSEGAAYDVHPYMLLNYNGKYEDVSTLAHELGHTMHSYLANKAQPYTTSQYSIFVAEVASTLNEALLMDYMLKTVKDDNTRLSLLFTYLDGVKATLFRQVQFADFELRIHDMADSGKTLTGDLLDATYQQIVRKYYGHDQGVCTVDDEMKAEWAYIPHFYYNFYVYQYATSITASSAISEQILAGDASATSRYLAMLASGGSDYPIELLKKAGVDMTTSQPFDLVIKKLNRVMDEVDKILAKKGK